MDADDLAGVIADAIGRATAPLVAHVAELEAVIRERTAALDARIAAVDGLGDACGLLRERVAVLETRAPVPGPAGADGADGVGFDDVAVSSDGERTITIRFTKGDRVRVFPIPIPALIYRGVWNAGQYLIGDVVTWQGSAWICRQDTSSQPGDGDSRWTLAVKRGKP